MIYSPFSLVMARAHAGTKQRFRMNRFVVRANDTFSRCIFTLILFAFVVYELCDICTRGLCDVDFRRRRCSAFSFTLYVHLNDNNNNDKK